MAWKWTSTCLNDSMRLIWKGSHEQGPDWRLRRLEAPCARLNHLLLERWGKRHHWLHYTDTHFLLCTALAFAHKHTYKQKHTNTGRVEDGKQFVCLSRHLSQGITPFSYIFLINWSTQADLFVFCCCYCFHRFLQIKTHKQKQVQRPAEIGFQDEVVDLSLMLLSWMLWCAAVTWLDMQRQQALEQHRQLEEDIGLIQLDRQGQRTDCTISA